MGVGGREGRRKQAIVAYNSYYGRGLEFSPSHRHTRCPYPSCRDSYSNQPISADPLSYPILSLSSRTHTSSYPPRFFLACPNQPNRASRITVCFWMTLKYYPPLHGLGSDTYFIPPYAGFQIASSYFRHPDTTLPFEALKYDDVRELLSSERVIASSSRK